MNFAEQLKAQSDLAVINFANELAERIKPKLEAAAKEGYSAYRLKVQNSTEEEKKTFHIYTHSVLIDQLNKKLDRVSIEHKKEYIENLIFPNRGWHEHYLVFRWG